MMPIRIPFSMPFRIPWALPDNLAPYAALLFGGLVGLTVVLFWMAFRPSRAKSVDSQRMAAYLQRADVLEEELLSQSFQTRVLAPAFRKVLRSLARMAPQGNIEQSREMLVQAGSPMGLTVMDYLGMRILAAALFGGGFFVLSGARGELIVVARNAFLLAFVGYFLPLLWLRSAKNQRQRQIQRALPDALDMLTIGVEAGLGFESAMIRVGDQWDNPLTREFRRAVAEMRVGTSREDALLRMVERCGVADLRSFVAVLVQSSRLGVSIAEVLHVQADQMRVRRRLRAEEQAHKATVKMVFPLVLLIFPALFVVILGPVVPSLLQFLGSSL
jgi:tight adherence protein C